MPIFNTSALLHEPMVRFWHEECAQREQKMSEFVLNRFERLGRQTDRVKGDDTLKQLVELFTNGFGIDWSPVQIKVCDQGGV